MSPDRFRRLSYEQLKTHLQSTIGKPLAEPGEFPSDEQLVWTTGRHAMWTSSENEETSADSEQWARARLGMLGEYTQLHFFHELAAEIRRLLRRKDVTPSDIVKAIEDEDAYGEHIFVEFPHLLEQIEERFGDAAAEIKATQAPTPSDSESEDEDDYDEQEQKTA